MENGREPMETCIQQEDLGVIRFRQSACPQRPPSNLVLEQRVGCGAAPTLAGMVVDEASSASAGITAPSMGYREALSGIFSRP